MLQLILAIIIIVSTIAWYFCLFKLNDKFLPNEEKKQANMALIFSILGVISITILAIVVIGIAPLVTYSRTFMINTIYSILTLSPLYTILILGIPLIVLPGKWSRYFKSISIQVFYWLGFIFLIISYLQYLMIPYTIDLDNMGNTFLIIASLAFIKLIFIIVMLVALAAIFMTKHSKIESIKKISNVKIYIFAISTVLVFLLFYISNYVIQANQYQYSLDYYYMLLGRSYYLFHLAMILLVTILVDVLSIRAIRNITIIAVVLIIIEGILQISNAFISFNHINNDINVALRIFMFLVAFVGFSFVFNSIFKSLLIKISFIILCLIVYLLLPLVFGIYTYMSIFWVPLAMHLIYFKGKYLNV